MVRATQRGWGCMWLDGRAAVPCLWRALCSISSYGGVEVGCRGGEVHILNTK